MWRLAMWMSMALVLTVAALWVDSTWTRREWDWVHRGYTYGIMSQAGHVTVRVFAHEAEDEYMKEYQVAYWSTMVLALGTGVGANTVLWTLRQRKEGPGFPVEQRVSQKTLGG